MNLKIEDLPMATSTELYQLSWIIEQRLADPRPIVQAPSQMHLGQQVQYFNRADGKLRPGQVVSIKDSRITVLEPQTKRHVSLSRSPGSFWSQSRDRRQQRTRHLRRPGDRPTQDFRVAQRLSFIDADMQHRVGVIVRIDQQTATVSCDGCNWRVSFPLLHRGRAI